MIMVDSSVWIDGLRGRSTPQTTYLDRYVGSIPFLVGDLILAEVLQGFSDERQAQEAERCLLKFELVALGGRACALRAAAHYRRLRTLGFTVRKTVDVFIATWCICHDVALLHHDRDFDPFETHLGLRVIHPERESDH